MHRPFVRYTVHPYDWAPTIRNLRVGRLELQWSRDHGWISYGGKRLNAQLWLWSR